MADDSINALGEPPSLEDIQSAFAEAGVVVDVEQRHLTLTASSTGSLLIGIFIGGPLNDVVNLMVSDGYAKLKGLLARLHEQRGSRQYDIFLTENSVDVRLDQDLPPEAYMKLQTRLPPAPSGRLIYSLELGKWVDSDDIQETWDS